jgi:hypothetical protein
MQETTVPDAPVKAKRKPNSASFIPGPDSRRHILSKEEKRKGFVMAQRSPKARRFRVWLWRKISRFYVGKPCRKSSVKGIEALERLERYTAEQPDQSQLSDDCPF